MGEHSGGYSSTVFLLIRGAMVALGAVLAVLGLGGIQGDIKGWASFLGANANLSRTLAVILGVGIVVAAAVGPRLVRWWSGRSGETDRQVTRDTMPPGDKRLVTAVLQAQLSSGRERLAKEADLRSGAENAEARAIALRLDTDEWRLPIELALASDGDALEDFRRPVDTQQMHYIDAAPQTLRVLLERLRRIVGEPKASHVPSASTGSLGMGEDPEPTAVLVTKLREREERLRTAVDTLVTWLYRRENWLGLSTDARSREPAPAEIWATDKYRDLGLIGIAYEPPEAIVAEPGFGGPDASSASRDDDADPPISKRTDSGAESHDHAPLPEAPDAAMRQVILAQLHQKYLEESRSGSIDRLQVDELAIKLNISRSRLQDILSELLLEGVIEPHYPTLGEGPLDGAVAITTLGLREIRRA